MKVSFTPIRSGSKGVPHKNIRLINGKPLFHYVVLQAQKVPSLDEVWISTESEHYASLAPPGVLVHKRPKELAEDHVATAEVIIDFLKSHPYVSTLVLLQATSPTTMSKDIKEALRHSASGKGCVSVKPVAVDLFFGNEPIWISSRANQEEETSQADAGVLVIHTANFLKTRTIPTFPCITMKLEHPVCDIDTERDFEYAETLLSKMYTAFIDIDENFVRLQTSNFTEQWSAPKLYASRNQLNYFILDKIKTLDENEIYIGTDAVVSEADGHYLISSAPEGIPFFKGSVFPKFVDGKNIKMIFDGDSAIVGLVRKNNIQQKNLLILIFGTEILSGLYLHGNVVRKTKVGELLSESATGIETLAPKKLVAELHKIKDTLSLDCVYVSGRILKQNHFVDIFNKTGIKMVDPFLNICENIEISA